jgi:hypothetical protein
VPSMAGDAIGRDDVDAMVSNKHFINRSLDNFSPCNFCITSSRVLC